MSFNFKQANVQRLNSYIHSSTTTLKLTTENSGSLVFLDCSNNNVAVDLPPVTDSIGINYDFLVSNSTGSAAMKINARDKSNNLEAKIKIVGNQSVSANNTATLTVAGTAQIGDRLSVISDGSFWYINQINASTSSLTLGAL
jgi:hypothetical protein|tara:strand:- start:113 stop:538 length:426 start_codon:yes stop_codon:yes gene_type:complete